VGELARGVGLGEEDVEEVGDEERPGDGDCAEEEEDCEEERDAEGMAQNNEGLEAALEGDGEGREVDTVRATGLVGMAERKGENGHTGSFPSLFRLSFR
jgi:hypothetical protein